MATNVKVCAGCDVKMFCHALNTLSHNRQGFDYHFHNRIGTDAEGVYAFWLTSGACLYVGMSANLRQRIYQHRMNEHNTAL